MAGFSEAVVVETAPEIVTVRLPSELLVPSVFAVGWTGVIHRLSPQLGEFVRVMVALREQMVSLAVRV